MSRRFLERCEPSSPSALRPALVILRRATSIARPRASTVSTRTVASPLRTRSAIISNPDDVSHPGCGFRAPWPFRPPATEVTAQLEPIGATPGRNHGRAIECRRVLQGEHAACILVERVEKPTDNRPARLLCYRAADADSPETIGPLLAPAHFPTPPPRAWGPRLLRRKYPVPC